MHIEIVYPNDGGGSKEFFTRTLIGIIGVQVREDGQRVVEAEVFGWCRKGPGIEYDPQNPDNKVLLPIDTIPEELRAQLDTGSLLLGEVNIAAFDKNTLGIRNLELAPRPISEEEI